MIRIISVGKTKEKWLQDALAEYVKRLGRFTKIELVEVREEKVIQDSERVKKIEAERILKNIKDFYVIALDSCGKQIDSGEMAVMLKKMEQCSCDIAFVIGGPMGLSKELLKNADMQMSLSNMTFTHQMVRLILLEQVYRGHMINAGREYHK
ncbi:MAG: 23S rRNA (pseudouridine(1915)-N(3))-methyltransferase RlmH [Candidatus Woesearchaeota archaeon]